MTGFTQFPLDESILKSLDKMGYKEPSAIQQAAIPPILEGRDLIALSQTGSGKTAACAIPICQIVDPGFHQIQALILVPTRELAIQYSTETQKVGKAKGVRVFAILGGEDAHLQISKLEHGVHVLIATPGRLIDFIYRRAIDLTKVKTIILDEADEMLSMGFHDDLDFIIQCLVHEHQTLLFSATMPKAITEIAKKYMRDPIEVALTKQNASPSRLEHHFMHCPHYHRDQALIKLMQEENPHQAIVFCHSRHQVEKVCQALKKEFASVDYLHAGLSQDLRSTITNKYRSGKIKVLVATDIAARGLDFSNVTHVFIYELSDDPEVYVHRSGRTGRFDKSGKVITLVTQRELHKLPKILKLVQVEPKWIGPPPPPKK
jgi:ATP-dependent RNA helicase DeaD